MVRKVQFEGRNIIVPDDATDDEVAQIIGGDVPPVQKQGTTLSDVGRWIGEPYANIGRLATEVPATLLTGMGSMLAGNVMGAASDIYSSVTGQPKVGEKVREDVMRDYTYQPRSAVAQEAFNLLGEGMKTNAGKLVQGLPIVGQELPILSTLAGPATRTVTKAIAEKAAAPSESIVKFAAQNQPKIDAAVQARRLGVVVDPAEVNPTLKNIAGTEFARPEILDVKAAKINLPIVQNILRNEAGIEGNVLTGETLQAARDVLSKPYNEVRKLGALQANTDVAAQLRSSTPKPIVGLEKQTKEASKSIEKVAADIEAGNLSASDAVDAIRAYRDKANNWYKIAEKGDAKRNPQEMAKAYQSVANTLESLIEANIPADSKLLNEFKSARKNLAKNYAVEALINKESGIPDLSKLSSARFADAPLSGDLAALRQIQANFPEATAAVNKYGALLPSTINRSSVGGTAGAAASMAAGGAPVTGGVLGAVTSVLGGRFVGNKMLTPEYQAKNLFPNVPRVATPEAAVPTSRIVPINKDIPYSGLPNLGEPPVIPGSWREGLQPKQQAGMLPVLSEDLLPMVDRYTGTTVPIGRVEGGMLTPKETPLPIIPREGRGMLSLADDQPIQRASPQVESVNFPSRLDVMNTPVMKNAVASFIDEAESIKSAISTETNGFKRSALEARLRGVENRFMAGLKQMGIRNESEARNLMRKVYETGGETQRGIEKVFTPMRAGSQP